MGVVLVPFPFRPLPFLACLELFGDGDVLLCLPGLPLAAEDDTDVLLEVAAVPNDLADVLVLLVVALVVLVLTACLLSASSVSAVTLLEEG